MYVARPGLPEAKQLVNKYDKSRRAAALMKSYAVGSVIGLAIALIIDMIIVIIWPPLTPAFFSFGSTPMLVLILAAIAVGVLTLVSLGFKLTSSSLKRQLKSHIDNGNVLVVDSSISRRWQKERENDRQIDQDDLFELQVRFNAMLTAWRRDLTDS